MIDLGTVLEIASPEERATIAARLKAQPDCVSYFYDEAIDEIARRLRTMPLDTFIEAACDILRQSRIEPSTIEPLEE